MASCNNHISNYHFIWGKKIPELARGLGLGLKEFKKASREIKDEVNNTSEDVNDDNAPPI